VLADPLDYEIGNHDFDAKKHSSNDCFESFLTGFVGDTPTRLKGSEIGCELVFLRYLDMALASINVWSPSAY
jgi:hypothetical protein